MPVQFNSIGANDFQDLVGTVYPKQAQIEVIERPGVDSLGARNNGSRGKPFKLVSITYHDNFDRAAEALSDYAVDTKGSLVVLVKNSTVYGNVIVLDVAESTPAQAVYNVAGAPGKGCRAEVEWTLVMM